MAEPDRLLELGDGAGGWARCGLWWSSATDDGGPNPAAQDWLGPGRPIVPLGRIGRLQASGPASAAALLERACAELHQRGCAAALAPLDGDTWHPYRLLVPPQDPDQAFAGEPEPDPRWSDWLAAARCNGLLIPTACLGGSCGACEIEINGQVVRACISTVPASRRGALQVELASDPYW